MAYESMGKDITEPAEPKETPKPAKPKLEKVPPPPPEPKPPAIAKAESESQDFPSTVSEAYHKLIKRKEYGHWDKAET